MKRDRDEVDEVWAVNRGLRLHRHHVAFVLDDLKREAFFDPQYGIAIAKNTSPVITSQVYPDFGDHVYGYPLDQIAAMCGRLHVRPYLHNSIPMMIAYALLIGVKTLRIHGADYTRPDGVPVEPSRANVEYWIGICERSGMDVGVSANCRLLGRHDFPEDHVYGYDKLDVAHGLIREGIALFQAEQERQKIEAS